MKRLLALFILLSAVAVAQDGPHQKYPEHGTIVAVHARRISPGAVFGVGKNYETAPSVSVSRGSCRVETATQFYEFTVRGRTPKFMVGESIDFRIRGQKMYVGEDNGKVHQYHIVTSEAKSATSQE